MDHYEMIADCVEAARNLSEVLTRDFQALSSALKAEEKDVPTIVRLHEDSKTMLQNLRDTMESLHTSYGLFVRMGMKDDGELLLQGIDEADANLRDAQSEYKRLTSAIADALGH